MNYNLEYKNFIGQVEYSIEDVVFHGIIINAGGDLVTFESNTFEEIEKEFRDAVDDYIETCKKISKGSKKLK